MGRRRFSISTMSWLAIICIGFTISTSSGQQVGTSCTEPRIRRSWDMYSAEDKALYLEAVGLAMDKGFHMKFVQIHTETQSGNEAHQNCMFIYWHRMMLLGYENMLRSLGDKFQCVTIPYLDHLSATARQAAGSCTSLQSCTPYLADSGGTSLGTTKSLNIYGTSISSTTTTMCVNQGTLAHFCGNNTVCAQCVTRRRSSSMSTTKYPGEATFASVYSQVFSYNISSSFTNAVERGVHSKYSEIYHSAFGLRGLTNHYNFLQLLLDTLHNSLSGVMAYLQAPVDPIFYSHHGLIDVLQNIYLKCQIGAENVLLSADAKSSDSRWYSKCSRKNGVAYTTADNITMRALAFDGKTYVNVWQDPKNILYPFFKDLPYKYTDYIDAKDLGNYSYTYAISGGLANMYQNCWSSNKITSVTTLLADESDNKGIPNRLRPIIEPGTANDDVVKRWSIALFEAARIVGYSEPAARDQMEMVTCQYQEDCLGGVDDFSELYKTNFGIEGHTRCFTIIQDLQSRDRVIGIPQWKEITYRFLPCSKYKKRPQSAFEKVIEQYAGTSTSAFVLGFVHALLLIANPNVNSQQVGTACSEPRVRKSWDAFTATEKALYIEAVGAAMKGERYHQKFVQIHATYANGLEAHKSCMFVYWHRMLLLGYENMLRSLSPAYACITVPYWDHLSGTAQQESTTCSTIENCSPIIADFGGTTGVSKSLSVYNFSISYTTKTTCVNQGLAGQFCGNNTGCANCIMRTRSKYLPEYPAEAYLGSVYQQLFRYNAWANVTAAIENGIHNAIHNAMGGIMAFVQASVDPIFYSHHALIDALQTIYLKCQLGDETALLSADSKSSDTRFWASCAKPGGGTFSGTDTVTMRLTSASDSKTYVDVWRDPNNILYPFFKDLPNTYAAYVDAKDLGNYSYTYEISGGLANMYQNCSASVTLDAVSTTPVLLAANKQASVAKPPPHGEAPLCHTVTDGTDQDDTIKRWHIALFESATLVGFEEWAAREQMEMVTCQHYVECVGPAKDYSDLYRANFRLDGHPRCFLIAKDIAAGKRVIGIPGWRDITSRFVPCPLKDGAYPVTKTS
ncbi:unnamed protein product [Phytophthora lilii]|uniref:Unnamed protein product n=1 Tax=Phytophthora lilii TaxID=2077276 RepID=A0A9W6WZX5_9STRA|nr:unnamed protein product [Phytophthora lilii]